MFFFVTRGDPRDYTARYIVLCEIHCIIPQPALNSPVMKRLFTSLSCCAICLLFVSCFEIVESVSMEKGKYKISYRIAVSKTLCELGEIDFGQLILDILDDPGFWEDPAIKQLKKIDTDFETGLFFRIEVPKNPKNLSHDWAELVPTKEGDAYIFSLDWFNEGDTDFHDLDDQLSSDFTKMFLEMAKYRILMSKSLMPKMSSARLVCDGWTVYEGSFYDEGDVWSVEVPMSLLFAYSSSNTMQLELR